METLSTAVKLINASQDFVLLDVWVTLRRVLDFHRRGAVAAALQDIE